MEVRGQLCADDPDQTEADPIAPDGALANREEDERLHRHGRAPGTCWGVEESIFHAESEVTIPGLTILALPPDERLAEQPHLQRPENPDAERPFHGAATLGGPGREPFLRVDEPARDLETARRDDAGIIGDGGAVGGDPDLLLGGSGTGREAQHDAEEEEH
jgi:hypothetical protein